MAAGGALHHSSATCAATFCTQIFVKVPTFGATTVAVLLVGILKWSKPRSLDRRAAGERTRDVSYFVFACSRVVCPSMFPGLSVLALELHVATKGVMGYEPSGKTAEWLEYAEDKNRREIRIRGGPCPINEGSLFHAQGLSGVNVVLACAQTTALCWSPSEVQSSLINAGVYPRPSLLREATSANPPLCESDFVSVH